MLVTNAAEAGPEGSRAGNAAGGSSGAARFLPVLGEGLLRGGDRGSGESDVRVPPGFGGDPVAEPVVADAETARESDAPIHHHDLAVISREFVARPREWSEKAHVTSGLGELGLHVLTEIRAAEVIDEDTAADAGPRAVDKCRDDAIGRHAFFPDVHHDVDAAARQFGSPSRGHRRRSRCRAA